jgi:hypothetical protein
MVFEMMNSIEMYIIHCAAFVGMTILHLFMYAARLSDFDTLSRSVSAYSAENSGIWTLLLDVAENSSVFALLSYLGKLVVDRFLNFRLLLNGLHGTINAQAFSSRNFVNQLLYVKICSTFELAKVSRCVPECCIIAILELMWAMEVTLPHKSAGLKTWRRNRWIE